MSTVTTSAHLMTCNKACVAEIRKGLRAALAAFRGIRLTVQMGQGSTYGTCLVIVERSNAATIAALEWLKANHFEDALTAHGAGGLDVVIARHREYGNERFDMNVMRHRWCAFEEAATRSLVRMCEYCGDRPSGDGVLCGSCESIAFA